MFELPFRAGAFARWGYISAGLVFVQPLGLFLLMLSGAMGGGFTGHGVAVGIAFLLLPLFWVGWFTGSYAAACCTAVMESTAAGRDRVDHWPDPDWKSWAAEMIPLAYLLLPTAVVAFYAGAFAGEPWRFPVTVGVGAILYPFLVLSAYECGQPWAPLSGVVLGSLFTLWWAWLAYYAMTALVTGVWAGLVWLGAYHGHSPFITMVGTAPLLAYVLLVNARLLGRLAWKIGDHGVTIDDDE